MSIKLYQNKVNRIYREIGDLEKKIGSLNKEVNRKETKIFQISKSLKNASMTTLNSRMSQIEHLQKDAIKVKEKISDLSKKLGSKRTEYANANERLQKEIEKENKKQFVLQDRTFKLQQASLKKLTTQLEKVVREQTGKSSLYNDILSETSRYDVFLSHASEDKLYVDTLAEELENRGFSVWYDKNNVMWGDSVRSRIDNGLKLSKFAIVVLSENYFKKYWTQYELDGLFNKEIKGGKVILPLWHNITYDQVAEYSYSLAGRDALNTNQYSPSEIADALDSMTDYQ